MDRVLILATILASLGNRVTYIIHIEPRNPDSLFSDLIQRGANGWGERRGERERERLGRPITQIRSQQSSDPPEAQTFPPSFKHFGRHCLNELLS